MRNERRLDPALLAEPHAQCVCAAARQVDGPWRLGPKQAPPPQKRYRQRSARGHAFVAACDQSVAFRVARSTHRAPARPRRQGRRWNSRGSANLELRSGRLLHEPPPEQARNHLGSRKRRGTPLRADSARTNSSAAFHNAARSNVSQTKSLLYSGCTGEFGVLGCVDNMGWSMHTWASQCHRPRRRLSPSGAGHATSTARADPLRPTIQAVRKSLGGRRRILPSHVLNGSSDIASNASATPHIGWPR
jgi:hypothetical protein